jgi:prolyl 4-hydroxylase
MALAAPRLARSETVDNATGGSEVNAARTSDGMFFERGEAPLITAIEQRIATLLRWPVANGEGLQILRYRPGAEYRPHHDYFDPEHPGTARILERGGQRVGTLVMYLNTPEGGGATTFPDIGLEVAPVRGNAVFFSYDHAHPDTRALHGGAPVTAGEKWVATKWLREGVFE